MNSSLPNLADIETSADVVYRSMPATMSSCLKSWGDCGNAKNWPSCTRLGTR